MHNYQQKSFTLEQEARLRASSGPSVYIPDFLKQKRPGEKSYFRGKAWGKRMFKTMEKGLNIKNTPVYL